MLTFGEPIDIPTNAPVKMHIIEANMLDPTIAILAPTLLIRGWGNGYIRLPNGHPYFGVHFLDIPYPTSCGFNYSDLEQWQDEVYWVIGFDTGHFWNHPGHDEAWVREETLYIQQHAIADWAKVNLKTKNPKSK